MKVLKFIITISTLMIIASCSNSTNSSQEGVKLKVENYLDTVEKKFPNFETNSAINDELNEYLRKDLQKAINKDILIDLPFKLEKVEKCGTRYVLDLEHSLTSKLYDRGVLSELEIDLYALTDEKTAKSLQEGQFYLVSVKFKDYINFKNKEKYCAMVLMSPFMGYFSNEIQFGAIAVDLKKINKVEK